MKNKNIITHITKAALAVALIFISLTAKAAVTTGPSGTCGEGLTYTFNSETGALVISKTSEGSGKIEYKAFDSHNDIKSVTIGDGVTEIGQMSFYGCDNLTSATIPNSVTSIKSEAFMWCSNLSVTIPSSVTSIGYRAFFTVKNIINQSSCTSDSHWGAKIYNGIVDGDFIYLDNNKTQLGGYIGKGGNVTIPDGVISIGKEAFRNCKNLTSVTIPDGVISIGTEAFYNCKNLTSVTIPSSVTSIGDYAFQDCFSLTSVTIPSSVTSIGTKAFDNVKCIINNSLYTEGSPWGALVDNGFVDGDFIYLDNNKTQLGAYIGKGGNVTIPDGVISIGKYAFSSCESLTSVTIPRSVTSIGENAFYGCTNVTDVYLYADCDNLQWDYCDIDNFKENRATNCHVLAQHRIEYHGVNVTFVDDVIQLTADDITTSQISDVTYTGTPFTPEIEVKYGDKTLEAGIDYTVFYSNNINVGAAKATITVIITKLCIGIRDIEFNINPRVTTLGALTLTEYGDRTTATLQGEFTSTETTSLEINDLIEVSELTFQRTFTAGVPATVMLPFSFAANKVDGKFYTLASVAPINGVWTATMSNPINGIIQANTPYIFKANSNLNKLTFENGDDGVTLQSTKTINDNTNGDWTLHGVYEKTQLDGSNQVNYGFAGQATDDGISVGDFIRAGEGVWADPMRCYLTYNKNNGVLTKSALDLPDNIRVVFPDEVEEPDNGEIVTPVSEIATESGVKVWSYDGTVYIEAQPDMDYTIVDLTGRTIKKGVTHSTHEELNLNTKGIVIVKIGNKTFKLK